MPDAAQSFGKNSVLRFSNKNPFDFLLWDSRYHRLFALELKTVCNNSISFERGKNEKGLIHYHQIKGLNDWSQYDGIICGFIIEFRKIETTVFIEIGAFNLLIEKTGKKSFNFSDLVKYGIPYTTIKQVRKKTRYKYDIESFLNDINKKIVLSKENENIGGTKNEM